MLEGNFSTQPLKAHEDYRAFIAQRLAEGRLASTGYVSDLGIADIAPGNQSTTTDNTTRIWGTNFMKFNSHQEPPYRAKATKEGFIQMYQTDGRDRMNRWRDPVMTIDPANMRILEGFGVTGLNMTEVPESGVLYDRYFRTHFVLDGNDYISPEKLEELFMGLKMGKRIDPDLIRPMRHIEEVPLLQVSDGHVGKRVVALMFEWARWIPGAQQDGVVIDLNNKELLPKRIIHPFA